ncbi:MAG: hypothetical protein FWH04_05440 [Oscillospiraceae bacterium]|nr:hypothetical protein [Oscillospiraceae bacterium]
MNNNATYSDVQDLAVAHWLCHANETAYKNGVITKAMYEYARDELKKSVDKLSQLCYTDGKVG